MSLMYKINKNIMLLITIYISDIMFYIIATDKYNPSSTQERMT